jgi:hypothetical protein
MSNLRAIAAGEVDTQNWHHTFPTIDRLLRDSESFPFAVKLTIRDIVHHLRREEGFDGSYDSVRNYIHRRARDEESPWARAYDLMVCLPKPRALDFIRCLARGQPPAFASAQFRSFIREAACPRMLSARSSRERQRLLHIEWMRRLLQKELNEDDLIYDLSDIPGLSTLLGRLHNGRLWISQRRRLIDISKIGMHIFRGIQREPGRKSGAASGSYLRFLMQITVKIRITDNRFL